MVYTHAQIIMNKGVARFVNVRGLKEKIVNWGMCNFYVHSMLYLGVWEKNLKISSYCATPMIMNSITIYFCIMHAKFEGLSNVKIIIIIYLQLIIKDICFKK